MSFAQLKLYFVTLNCGRAFVNEDSLSTHFFKPYEHGLEMPDIVVLSLQEIAPLPYCFVSQSWIQPYLSRVLAAAQQGASVTKYHHVATHTAGLTGIIVLAKEEIQSRITWLEKADVGVGLWEMGNKGAAAIRLGYFSNDHTQQISLTFVAAHLAAHEMDVKRRNRDWENIVRNLAFSPSQRKTMRNSPRTLLAEQPEAEHLLAKPDTPNMVPSGIFAPHALLFFGGDLNYRTSSERPEKDGYRHFPQPIDDRDDEKHYRDLMKHDQLAQERAAKRTLHNLAEAAIDFPPSYKYDLDFYKDATPQARGVNGEPSLWHWANHRSPSWCDRVLFSSFLEQPGVLKTHAYTVLPIQPTTDHRPVALAVSLDLDKAARILKQGKAYTQPPFPLNPRALSVREAARSQEILVGILAYLATTWEGCSILLATVVAVFSGWLIMKSYWA